MNVLRKENLELKEENSCPNERDNNLSYILADLQDKAKRADDEKNSLNTTIRLLHNNAIINHSLNDNEFGASDDANAVHLSVKDEANILIPDKP